MPRPGFFFSSRRRHTRFDCDWSSDVCSSDLVMAMVRSQERTFASGITNLVRLGGWALAPSFAGLLMQGTSLAAPLFVGAGMKISYDLLLYRAFRRVKPPEET